ncbi:MAG: ATP-dependent sacrificial sulfur transferase LarE [Desulfobacteraceae bacterium]|nr:MAG: ATP-dependent sacrificial sulfur transferase LarE [Desulfobacteraceae bacterium]
MITWQWIHEEQSISVKSLQQKQDALTDILRKFDSLMIAFSGGVDSTFLLSVAGEVLKEKVTAVTSLSIVHPKKEFENARRIAETLGVNWIAVDTDEMRLPEFKANQPDRCYVCKRNLFQVLQEKALEMGIQAICHGANVDDLDDIRPGFAAATEYGIHAPLIDAGLTKADIRQLSRDRGLSTWDKPAMACLATRIPFGTTIKKDMLRMIESAEQILHAAGFTGSRVRHHGKIARIEIPKTEFGRLIQPEILSGIVPAIQKIGFPYVALDLEGYRQGSMNQPTETGPPASGLTG